MLGFGALLLSLIWINVAYCKMLQYLDPFCTLLGTPTRDPAQFEQVFVLKRQQKCNVYIGGGTIGIFDYSVNRNNVPIVNSGIMTITKENLNKGSYPSAIAQTYINYLSRGDIAGQVIGYKLGGSGNDLSNIFPQNSVSKLAYEAFEQTIYDCLSNNLASKALLRWTFYYLTTSASRPYQVLYQVSYADGTDNCSGDFSQKLHN